MAYEVTATRKRPQVFDNLAGQEFVVSTIKNSIKQGRIAHAYLFSGPRGVGKTSSARILAKALNCEEGPTSQPCGICVHCKEITQGNATDVIEIDGASNTSVNDIRIIKDEVLFPPQSCRYKIYIIDEVHMLSTSAFNALLKTIEEPPEYVIFIFATTETQKVPATIRSRCQQFHFHLIPIETIQEILRSTAQEMEVEAEEEALFWIAKESTGSMRDAYTLFDQVISFSDSHITLEKIEHKLGLTGIDQLVEIMENLESGDPIGLLSALLDKGISIEQCIKDFAEFFRILLLLKRNIEKESILGVHPSRIPAHIRTAYNDEQLEAGMSLFLNLYRDIRFSLNPRFELELAVSKLSRLHRMASSASLVAQITQLKEELKTGIPVTFAENAHASFPIERTVTPVKEVPAPVVEKKTPPPNRIQKQTIAELIQSLAQERDPLGIILSQVIDVHQTEKAITLTFPNAYAHERAIQNIGKIQKIFERDAGFTGSLVCEKKEEQECSPISQENDPVIETLTTLFRGEILPSTKGSGHEPI